MKLYRRLILAAFALAAAVIVFGAYVRLADAGLGCPDWPGCYGQLSPHHAQADILQTQGVDPHGPVSLPKAWKEMIHRYLAASLGLLIVVIAGVAWRRRDRQGTAPGTATLLVGVVIFQGILGKWTVTLLLKPAIVTAHLLGGLTTLALLAWLGLRAQRVARLPVPPGVRAVARIGLALLVAQIVLGGWTSTNYASLACTDFPTCHGTFSPATDYGNAFHVVRELGMTADGDFLPLPALTAIHWSHRLGAVVAGAALYLLAWLLARRQSTQPLGLALLAAITLQVALGIANVVFGLPLALAVAHNAGAVLLVALLVSINYRVGPLRAEATVGRRKAAGRGKHEHQNSFA